MKAQVLAKVHEEVDHSTRVVIGHSLGSVVAYEYLCGYRPSSVELLVTLGSPLGIPNLVFDRLTPAPADGLGAWPGGVASWVNVADRDDIVALRKQLAGLFGPRQESLRFMIVWSTMAISRMPSIVTSTPAGQAARSVMSSADPSSTLGVLLAVDTKTYQRGAEFADALDGLKTVRAFPSPMVGVGAVAALVPGGGAMTERAVVGAGIERSAWDQIVAGRAMDGTSDLADEG